MASLFTFIAGLLGANATAADYNVAETYTGLRNMVFGTKPENLDIQLKNKGTKICA